MIKYLLLFLVLLSGCDMFEPNIDRTPEKVFLIPCTCRVCYHNNQTTYHEFYLHDITSELKKEHYRVLDQTQMDWNIFWKEYFQASIGGLTSLVVYFTICWIFLRKIK